MISISFSTFGGFNNNLYLFNDAVNSFFLLTVIFYLEKINPVAH